MSNSIPASQLVSVNPGVIGTGGSPLSLNSVFLTINGAVPIGSVQPFPTLLSVSNFFGPAAIETLYAASYFNGFDNSNIKPGNLFFVQYPSTAVAAYLRGGSLAGMTLAQLQALGSGVLTVTVNGTPITSATINLSATSSFTNAATLITTGLAGPVCTYDSVRQAFVITSTTSGAASTIGYASGSLSAGLLLTLATGAVTSQGSNVTTPALTMGIVTNATQNFGTFFTCFEPVLADKLLFAQWVNGQNQRYLYVCWDTTVTAIQPGNTTDFGPLVSAASYNGVTAVYLDPYVAAFLTGAIASVDFNQLNGRVTFAYKSQAGLTASVTDAMTAANLTANGYNFYGAYATANQAFTFFQTGQMAGVWKWIDAYVNQIYLNAQLQLALVSLLQQAKSLPYNSLGYSMIRAACADPINQALNFGSIRTGVPLSSVQAAQVNAAAGVPIDQTLTQIGYYLQILPATAQVRGMRGSPPVTLWYMDGGSIQKLNLASIDVQ